MRRQLDPDFFKESDPQPKSQDSLGSSATWTVLQKLEAEIAQLSQGYKKTALRISQMESRWEERHLSVLKKVEKLGHGLHRMEAFIGQVRKETADMATDLRQKVSDRRISDARLEDLLERHNSVLRQFEARTMALQKHLQDKDLQLINYAEGLKEARKEMARLKALIQGV